LTSNFKGGYLPEENNEKKWGYVVWFMGIPLFCVFGWAMFYIATTTIIDLIKWIGGSG